MNEIRPSERARLARDVADLWPGAPAMEAGYTGRWSGTPRKAREER